MIENLFLSIGAMKAGTTWLYEQLKHQPYIVSTPEKEIHYFEHVSGKSNPIPFNKRREKLIQFLADKNAAFVAQNLDKIQWYLHYGRQENINDEWYKKLFGNHAEDNRLYCADFSNLYALLQHKGWQRVKQNCNNLKVMYTMRDPISRVWSHYKFHMAFIGKEDAILSEGEEAFIQMLEKDWFWLHAEYTQVLSNLERFLKEDEYRIFYFEDFRNDPQSSLDDLMSFLNLPNFKLPKKAEAPINKSKELTMPQEFRNIALTKLAPIIAELKAKGRFHPDWNSK
jgi:hypothetical protein